MAFLRTAMVRTNLDIKVSCAFAYKRCIHGITQPPPLDSLSVTSPALSLPEIDRSLDPIHIKFGSGFNIGTGSMELMAVPKTKTKNYGTLRELSASCKFTGIPSVLSAYRESKPGFFLGAQILSSLSNRSISTLNDSHKSDTQEASATATDVPPRIKFKRLDKTARHIMQILDKEAVEEVHTQREIPDIKPGYIIQLRLEVPENKRRVSTVKGIVIARRNAGLNTTIRLRRMVAGVGVESLLPLYSPNVKEIKVLDKKKVRRAKLYYLREKMNALKK